MVAVAGPATEADRIELLSRLLDRGAEIDALDSELHSTPLGWAARYGYPRIVGYLLTRGADPNRAGAAWATPLAWAERMTNTEVADLLRERGATE